MEHRREGEPNRESAVEKYSAFHKGWKGKYEAAVTGEKLDKTGFSVSNEMLDELRPYWLAAVLEQKGYSSETTEVYLQPCDIVPDRYGLPGVKPAIVPEGQPIKVSIEDIDWGSNDLGKINSTVTVSKRGERGQFFLADNQK